MKVNKSGKQESISDSSQPDSEKKPGRGSLSGRTIKNTTPPASLVDNESVAPPFKPIKSRNVSFVKTLTFYWELFSAWLRQKPNNAQKKVLVSFYQEAFSGRLSETDIIRIIQKGRVHAKKNSRQAEALAWMVRTGLAKHIQSPSESEISVEFIRFKRPEQALNAIQKRLFAKLYQRAFEDRKVDESILQNIDKSGKICAPANSIQADILAVMVTSGIARYISDEQSGNELAVELIPHKTLDDLKQKNVQFLNDLDDMRTAKEKEAILARRAEQAIQAKAFARNTLMNSLSEDEKAVLSNMDDASQQEQLKSIASAKLYKASENLLEAATITPLSLESFFDSVLGFNEVLSLLYKLDGKTEIEPDSVPNALDKMWKQLKKEGWPERRLSERLLRIPDAIVSLTSATVERMSNEEGRNLKRLVMSAPIVIVCLASYFGEKCDYRLCNENDRRAVSEALEPFQI